MHLPAHSTFPLTALTQLMVTVAVVGTTDSGAIFYPSENKGEAHVTYNDSHSIEINPSDLSAIRGTTVYEKYVDDLIATGISKLTVTLNRMLTTQARGENVVFSPLSISSALALVLLGSNGITFKEISNLMGFTLGIPDLTQKSQVVHEQFSRVISKLIATSGFDVDQDVNVATAVFVQSEYPIRPLYMSTAQELYHSNILSVDFQRNAGAAKDQVNRWVEENTRGKIKTILSDIPPAYTKVILASALYFNAEWMNHFFGTKSRPFYVNGRNSPSLHEVDLMLNGGYFPYYSDKELGCEILGLPYKGNKSTMYVIMPFESSKEKLQQFQFKLTEKDLDKLVSKTEKTDATIAFPKMLIEGTYDLKDPLEALGVRSLFNPRQANLALISPGESGDSLAPSTLAENQIKTSPNRNRSRTFPVDDKILFSSRTTSDANPVLESRFTQTLDNIRDLLNQQSPDNNYQNPGLYADQVVHKVYMNITEKGTEAAASTSISLAKIASKVTFKVDVPFIFFIRHEETRTILFWGSVVVPTPNYRPK